MIDREEIVRRPPLSGEPPATAPSGLVPARAPIEGRHVVLEPLDPARHGDALFEGSSGSDEKRALWRFLGTGPYEDKAPFLAWLRDCAAAFDPIFYAICDRRGGKAVGMASYLNIAPRNGSIEVGHLLFTPALQRTTGATEAIYLMARHAMDDLRYRRFEWKCNALNEPSRRAATRFGFRFEGIFYRHMIIKGCNRDTAWYSIVDEEWPEVRGRFEAWLAPENFDGHGRAKRSLSETAR